MTPKQVLFAEQYVIDHCGAAAAVRAGYASRAARQTAYELLAKPDVQALVAEHETATAKQLALSRERVVTEIKAAIAMAREQQDPAAMIAGWREIAKLCGYYAPERRRVELSTGHDALRVQFEAMSDAELINIASGG
jgi:phage terminase small subunit